MLEVLVLLMSYLIKNVLQHSTWLQEQINQNQRQSIYHGNVNVDIRKCNLNQKWNNDKCWCECTNMKQHHVC